MDAFDLLELFDEEELFALKELDIEPRSLVFYKRSWLPFLSFLPFFGARRYVCRVLIKDGLYRFELPQRVPRQFKERISEIEKKLLTSNNAHTKTLMKKAQKDAEFIERFNSELFFKHSYYEDKKITAEEVYAFYETPPYCETINLTDDSDRQHFTALYAMAFYACSLEDLFTVDGIFSAQPERHSDNAKKTAGNSVFNLIIRNDKAEMKRVLQQMEKTLADVQPPRVNLADAAMLAKNYTLFAGVAGVAQAFRRANAAVGNESNAEVGRLMNYALLVQLCDEIAQLSGDLDYRETEVYEKCKRMFDV